MKFSKEQLNWINKYSPYIERKELRACFHYLTAEKTLTTTEKHQLACCLLKVFDHREVNIRKTAYGYYLSVDLTPNGYWNLIEVNVKNNEDPIEAAKDTFALDIRLSQEVSDWLINNLQIR